MSWMHDALLTFTLAQAPPAGAANGAAAATDAAAVQVQSVWDFIVKGGPMMIPIGICSVIVVTVAAERLVALRRRHVIPPGFMPELKSRLKEAGGDINSALKHCEKNDSPIARVFAAGVKRLGQPIELLEKHIQETGEREALGLRKRLRALSVIAAVAPLMGLLGTIFGMISAFQTVALSAEALGQAEMLASGIYEAMITTAAGLIVAIPALLLYHWIAAKIDRLVQEIDAAAVDFVEEHAMPVAGQTPAGRLADAAGNGRAAQTSPAPAHTPVETPASAQPSGTHS